MTIAFVSGSITSADHAHAYWLNTFPQNVKGWLQSAAVFPGLFMLSCTCSLVCTSSEQFSGGRRCVIHDKVICADLSTIDTADRVKGNGIGQRSEELPTGYISPTQSLGTLTLMTLEHY